MPICAIRALQRAALTALLVTAAAGCDESAAVTQAERDGVPLTSGRGASDQAGATAKPGTDNSAGTASPNLPAPNTVSLTTPAPSGAAGMGSPAGSEAVPPGPPTPVAGSFGGAGTIAITPPEPQRLPIRSAMTTGWGACSFPVEQFIAKAQQLRPEFRDIQQVVHFDPNLSPGASAISAYLEPDGTYSLVFRRGDGDCLAGCINNEYWYIAADDKCAPQQVGYYKRVASQNNCFQESGIAMWDEPRALDPQYACGANLMPQNLNGSHKLQARGVIQACARSGESIAPMSIDKTITLDIEQDAANLAKATVTVHDVGHPLLDNRKLTAEVLRRRVTVHVEENNLPNKCIKQNQVELEYDFEGLASRRLFLMEVDTPDCNNKPDDYCKGYVELTLSPQP